MKTLFYFTILACLVFALSCAETETQEPKSSYSSIVGPINPNGDSELALLMRAMFDDMNQMKTQIQNGQTPTPTVDFEKMFTVKATEPEKQASDRFKSFGQLHLQ